MPNPPTPYVPSSNILTSYTVNSTSFWGGRFGTRTPGADNQVFDGVIVRSAWNPATKSFFDNLPRPTTMAKSPMERVKPSSSARSMFVPTSISAAAIRTTEAGAMVGIATSCDRRAFHLSQTATVKAFPRTLCLDRLADVYYFGAAHPSTFNCVFADGSVHSLSYDIDVTLFNGLGTRGGGESVDTSIVD